MTTETDAKAVVALKGQQLKFVNAFVDDSNKKTYLNATQSAIAAEYSEASARQQGYRLLKNDLVAKAIAEYFKERRARMTEISVERVIRERERIAYFNPKSLYNEDGSLIPIAQLDDDTAAAIQSFEMHVVDPQYKMKYGDEGYDEASEEANRIAAAGGKVLKVKYYDKNTSLTALEKHLGMYKEVGSVPTSPLSIHIHLDPK